MTVDETVRAGYDAWAPTYDAIDNPLIAQAAVTLGDRAAWVRGARVLELGCGTGRNARWALDAGAAAFVGVDGSPNMLAVARRRVADSRARFVDGELVTPVEGRFDLALICLVLEHVRDVEPVVRAAARALEPGGRLVILELHPALHAQKIGANFRVGEVEHRLPSFAHDGEELSRAAQAAGLTVEVCRGHRPDPRALLKSPKLRERYAGQEILLELCAVL